MEALTRLYECLGRVGRTDGFERAVLDSEFRDLLTAEGVVQRMEVSSADTDLTLTTLYSWAAEAGCRGGSVSAGAMARWFVAQNCVRRPGGVALLIGVHRRAVEEHGDEGDEYLRAVLPVVTGLLAEEGRTEEVSSLLAHLETAGDRALLGLCLCNVGDAAQDAAERYADAEAADLGADVDAVYWDTQLRKRLLALARVCARFSEEDAPRGLQELRETFRSRPRSFNALYWGDEGTGALVEDALGLELPGMRLRLEACRERWYFDRVVRRTRAADRPGFPRNLLLSAALRSNWVTRWLAGESSTGGEGAVELRVREACQKVLIPVDSLYAELLSDAYAENPETEGHPPEVRALQDMIGERAPGPKRSAVLWIVLLLVTVLAVLGDPPAWGAAVLGVVLVVAIGTQFLQWGMHGAWLRAVLLPIPNETGERKMLSFLAGEPFLRRHRMYFSPLCSKDRVRSHLRPFWRAASFRETVQSDPMLAADLARRLGRHSIHTADDVSVLLARHLPREPA